MKIIELFKQFIIEIQLKEDLKKFLDFSIQIKKEKKGRLKSNLGGFQSDDLNKQEPLLFPFIKKIEFYSNTNINDLLKTNFNFFLDNIWININEFKDFNIPHIHPFSKISGVFYINVPKNSGNLIFINDTKIGNFINEKNIVAFNNYNSSSWSIKPKENTLYLFPSWLNHYVEPNLSKEKRISISFNLN